MMSVRIELNSEGIQALLKSAEMGEVLTEAAVGVAERAGDGFAVAVPHVGRKRLNVEVAAVTREAYRACLEDNALIKALGGG